VLSVVIPTLNAAQCLPAALRSVAAADELFVADGGSTDDTPHIATQAGAVAAPMVALTLTEPPGETTHWTAAAIGKAEESGNQSAASST